MTINQMENFLVLSKLLNFTRASEALNMTQPALSKIIVSIENEVGYPLLKRSKRNVALTDAGKNICKYFEQILHTYKTALESSQAIAQGLSGNISIGFSGVIAKDFLPKLIHHMNEAHPSISISLTDGTQEELVHQLTNDNLDLAFIDSFSLKDTDEFMSKVIFHDSFYVVCSKRHNFAKKDYITISDLRSEKLLITGKPMPFGGLASAPNVVLNKLATTYGLNIYECQSARSIASMLLFIDCNLGISIFPSKYLATIPEDVCLRPLIVDPDNMDSKINLDVLAIWKENKFENPCLETLLTDMDKLML